VIARGSVPVVRLVSIDTPGRRRFGTLKGQISADSRFDEPLPDEELSAWTLA
jgi:antitoxin (DNA-binding transcriptional repressor) of toxin-antitoxin stability system